MKLKCKDCKHSRVTYKTRKGNAKLTDCFCMLLDLNFPANAKGFECDHYEKTRLK